MIIKRKTQIILALMVMNVFLFQSCMTIMRGTSQKIPVTSNPSGAKIIVDGEEIDYAPLELKLKRKKDHIIRIEKQGYNPLEIRITRKTSAPSVGISIIGNYFSGAIPGAFLGALVAYALKGEEGKSKSKSWGAGCGVLIGWICTIITDFKSGANYTLSLKELNVTLKKIEGKPQPNFILIDTEQLQNIKWIRIKCADSDEKDEDVILD